MSNYLLAGGGTAGHVNPLLAVADVLCQQGDKVMVLGTEEGLEARLVPKTGLPFLKIPRLPMPRSLNRAALSFPRQFFTTVKMVKNLVAEHRIDVVVGFGGYVSAPAYAAAIITQTPFVVHEANAKPGIANSMAAVFTKYVGVATLGVLPRGKLVGVPVRQSVLDIQRQFIPELAKKQLGLDLDRPLLLVFGGSQGATRINRCVEETAAEIIASGWQIMHITGGADFQTSNMLHYQVLEYVDRMDLALGAADLVVSRSGASTVAELCVMGLPAVYIPYPFGNGEQTKNVAALVAAGGGRIIPDGELTALRLKEEIMPLLLDAKIRQTMSAVCRRFGIRNSTQNTVELIKSVLT